MIDVQLVRVEGVVEHAETSGDQLNLVVWLPQRTNVGPERCVVDPSFGAQPGDELDLCYMLVERRPEATLGRIHNRRTGAEFVFDALIRDACETQALVDHRKRGCLFGSIGTVVGGVCFGLLMPWWATLLALPLGWIIGGLAALVAFPVGVRQRDIDAVKGSLRGDDERVLRP